MLLKQYFNQSIGDKTLFLSAQKCQKVEILGFIPGYNSVIALDH